MSLPVVNLDDRRFQDIVDEAKRMIPRLCPEWTNHNISDPGVALIELFAWMTDLVLYRLNQVPDRLYTQFLNLVGVQPFSAQAATADLTFWLSAIPGEVVVVPAGTEVACPDGNPPIVFTTITDLRIDQPEMISALTGNAEDGLIDVLPALRYDRDVVTCFPSNPIRTNDAFYIGFDRSLAGQVIRMNIDTAAAGVGIDPQRPPIVWEAWTGEYWVSCEIYSDETGGLNRDGEVLMMVPRLHEPLSLASQRAWWVRVRLINAVNDQPTYLTSPQVRSVAVGCVGGTAVAEHSELMGREDLGRSTGVSGQTFDLPRRPILPRRAGEHIVIVHDDVESNWTEVADFSRSGPGDRHVVWDEAQGRVRFGPVVRHPDGRTTQHGAIPPTGARVVTSAFRAGGGSVGNVGSGQISALRSAIPYVDRVENLAPSRGGVDAESVENVKARGPMTVRTGFRAVTGADYERLALDATPKVARARCLPSMNANDPVRLLVVPVIGRTPDTHTIDDFLLNDNLYRTVSQYLDERRVIGTTLEIGTPFYVGVSVAVMVKSAAGRPPTVVRQRVLDVLYQYLSPIDGGVTGAGWPWGVPLTSASLIPIIAEVEGVSDIDELVMFEVDLRNGIRLGDAVDTITLDDRTLLLGSKHRVVAR
jgi:predicted phage baseplate assembly protein